jgi:hypothetical protein
VLVKQLPHSGNKIRTTDTSALFPFFSEIQLGRQYYLHNDGSLVVLSRADKFESAFFSSLLSYLPLSSSLQLYKLRIDNTNEFFYTIKIPLDYSSFKIPALKYFTRLFTGLDDISLVLNDKTIEACIKLDQVIQDKSDYCKLSEYPLYKYITEADFSTYNPTVLTLPKSNLSIVLTGQERCSFLVSLPDYRNITIKTQNILNSLPTYLQYLSISLPSPEQSPFLEDKYTKSTSLISKMSISDKKNDDDDPRVHTMGIDDAQKHMKDIKRGMFFISSTFLFNAESIQNLRESLDSFTGLLASHDIIPYTHTNSSLDQYVACFPGNADKSNHYQVSYFSFVNMLIQRYFEL